MEISDLFTRMQEVDSEVRVSLDPAIAGCVEYVEIIQELLTLALELQRQIISFTLLQIAFSSPEGPASVDLSPTAEEIRPVHSVTELISTLIPVTIHSVAQYYGDSVAQGSTVINARYQEILQSLSHQSKVVDRNIDNALIPAITTLGSAIYPQRIPPELLISHASESSISPVFEYGPGEVGRKVTPPQGIGPTPFGMLSPFPQVLQKMSETLLAPLIEGEGGFKTTLNLLASCETTTATLTKMQETLQQTLKEGYTPAVTIPPSEQGYLTGTTPTSERRDIYERQVPLITAASSLVTLHKIYNPLYEVSANIQETRTDSLKKITREALAPSFTSLDIQPQTRIESAEKGEPERGDRVEKILRPHFEIAAFTPRLTEHITPVRPQGISSVSEPERSEAGFSQVARDTPGLPGVIQAFSSSTTAARTVINELTQSFIPLFEATGGVVSPGMLFQGIAVTPHSPSPVDGKKALSSDILTSEMKAITTTESTRQTTIIPQFSLLNLAATMSPMQQRAPSFELMGEGSSPQFSLLNLAATISPIQQIAPSFGGITGKIPSLGTESSRFNLPTAVTTINEAFSVLENIHLLTTQPGKAPVSVQPASLPSHIGTLTQNITLAHSGGMAGAPPPRNEVTIHNTFNIDIAMKGQGDERELRELGQKIGTILSEELKRYGGITWR